VGVSGCGEELSGDFVKRRIGRDLSADPGVECSGRGLILRLRANSKQLRQPVSPVIDEGFGGQKAVDELCPVELFLLNSDNVCRAR